MELPSGDEVMNHPKLPWSLLRNEPQRGDPQLSNRRGREGADHPSSLNLLYYLIPKICSKPLTERKFSDSTGPTGFTAGIQKPQEKTSTKRTAATLSGRLAHYKCELGQFNRCWPPCYWGGEGGRAPPSARPGLLPCVWPGPPQLRAGKHLMHCPTQTTCVQESAVVLTTLSQGVECEARPRVMNPCGTVRCLAGFRFAPGYKVPAIGVSTPRQPGGPPGRCWVGGPPRRPRPPLRP